MWIDVDGVWTKQSWRLISSALRLFPSFLPLLLPRRTGRIAPVQLVILLRKTRRS